MRTMPAVLASSVVVVSADRAHRMQRSTSTEAMGRGLESILDEDEGTSESEDEAEEKLWLAINAAAGIFWRVGVCLVVFSLRDISDKAESVDVQKGRQAVGFISVSVPNRRGGLNRRFAG